MANSLYARGKQRMLEKLCILRWRASMRKLQMIHPQ